MNNLKLFLSQVQGKPLWDARDWYTFVNSLYLEVNQSPQLLALKNRLGYEQRMPTHQEKQIILNVISAVYTSNGVGASLIVVKRTSNSILSMNNLGREIVNKNLTL